MDFLFLALLLAGTSVPDPATAEILGAMKSGDGNELLLTSAPTKLGGKCKGRKSGTVRIANNGGTLPDAFCWGQLPNTDLIWLGDKNRSWMTVPASYFTAPDKAP